MSAPAVSLVLQWRRAAVFAEDPPGAIATIIGPPGATGPPGAQGIPGPQGIKGDTGSAPTDIDGGTI